MGSTPYGINIPSGSVLQRFYPCLMHLALYFCSVVDVRKEDVSKESKPFLSPIYLL